jgi:hypothetical protein
MASTKPEKTENCQESGDKSSELTSTKYLMEKVRQFQAENESLGLPD